MPRAATKNKKQGTNKGNTTTSRMVGTKGGATGAAVTNVTTTPMRARGTSYNPQQNENTTWESFQSNWPVYQQQIKQMQQDLKTLQKQVNQLCGIGAKSAAAHTKLYETMRG